MPRAEAPLPGAGRPDTVAVFSSRESVHDLAAVVGALNQAGGAALKIDLMVNGNAALAERFLAMARAEPARYANVAVWFSPFADKAHAWNEHVHTVWDGQSRVFNVDGYVTVLPGSLQALSTALEHDAQLLAATGIPSIGRSAAAMRRAMLGEGGLHGNLFLMKAATVAAFRARGIRLPVGLYRTDATLGAFMSFGLDPSRHAWDPKGHIQVCPDVTWHTPPRSHLRPADWKAAFKRAQRQAIGRLENRAVRHHLAVRQAAPESMPRDIQTLVDDWVRQCPDEYAATIRSHPLAWSALKRLRAARTDPAKVVPVSLVGRVIA